MLFRLCLILLSALVPFSVSAQDWATREVCTYDTAKIHKEAFIIRSEGELRVDAAAIPNGLGRFWQITSPRGQVSHLWGSMHSAHPLILALPEKVTDAISAARMVMPERSWAGLTRPAVNGYYAREETLRPDWSLFNIYHTSLNPDVIERMMQRLVTIGYGAEAVNYLDYDTLMFTATSDPCEDFYAFSLPIQDSHIEALGAASGAEIRGMEPRDAVNQFLDNPLNESIALAILEVYGAYLQSQDSSAARQTSAALYLAGETGLHSLLEEDFLINTYGRARALEVLTRTDNYLVEARNYTFIETLIPELQKGGVFAYVGFLHLPRDTGMIELLRSEGFTVERITLPGERP